jgi:PAS domain S-box-containing protein
MRRESRLLKPAVWLMNRLRFPQKFALISLLFLLPLVFVWVLLIRQINSSIDLVQRERTGAAYLRAVRNLYQDALLNQIETEQVLNGRISPAEVVRVRAEIARSMQTLAQADARVQGLLNTTQAYQTLQADWQKLQAQPVDQLSTGDQDLNARLIADIRALITAVCNSSDLFLDPRLDSYYLIDALVLKLPEAQNLQADTLTLDIPAMAQQGSTAGLARLATQTGLLQLNTDALQSGIQAAFRNAAPIQPGLNVSLQTLVDRNTEFINAVGRAWNAPVDQAQPIAYWSTGGAALQASFKLWDESMATLDDLLQARSVGLNQQRALALGITAFVLFVVAYLWLGFYRAVMQTVFGMERASQRMVHGDLSGKLELDNRDELGQIVTAFNRIATALVSSSAYRQAVVDNAADGILTVNGLGAVASFNPAAERIFGYSADQIIGSNVASLLPAALGPNAREMFAQLLGGEIFFGSNREVEGQRRDGALFPLGLALSETQVGDQKTFIAIVRDMTELKQAQLAAQESQRRLADIISFLPDPVFVVDHAGTVIAWNRAIEEMTGVQAEAILGKGNYEYALPFYGECRPILIDSDSNGFCGSAQKMAGSTCFTPLFQPVTRQ